MGISDKVWGSPLGLNLPGIRISVQGMIDALEAVGGREILDHLTYETDPVISALSLAGLHALTQLVHSGLN